MPLINRFQGILQGAMILTGNALQCRQGTPYPPAGNDYTCGSYISTNTALVAAAGFPLGTSFNPANASSSAIVDIPPDSNVVFAQLFWTVTNFGAATPNANVNLATPNGNYIISPDPLLSQDLTAFDAWRARDVTNIVNTAKGGVYTFSPALGPTIVDGVNVAMDAWYLIIIYSNQGLKSRFFSVNTGFARVDQFSPSSFTFSSIITPTSGAVNGFLLVTESFGDLPDGANIFVGPNSGSTVQIGNPSQPDWDGFAPYAYSNRMLPGNILVADCNNPNIGLLDTRGTFGTFNKNPFLGTAVGYARNSTDILGINISNQITNSQTSLFTEVRYAGAGSGNISSQSVQIDVNAANVGSIKTADKEYAKQGDTITYTLSLVNTGQASASNVVIIDTLPNGVSFVSNSLTVDGTTIPGANPQLPGYSLGAISNGGSVTVTFKAIITTTNPSPNPMINQAQATFSYLPGVGATPINSQVMSTGASTQVQNVVLTATKLATATVGIGDTITYTVILRNSGNTTAINVRFIDTIPSGTSYVSNSLQQDTTLVGGDPNPPGVTLPNGIVAGGVSTVQFSVTVLTIPSPNVISNDSSVIFEFIGDPSIPTIGSGSANSNTAHTNINYALVTSTKSANTAYAYSGGTITYRVVLKNTGVTTATNYVFIDTIPPGTSFVPNSLMQDTTTVPGNPDPPGAPLPNSIGINGTSTISFTVNVISIPTPNPIPNSASGTYSYVGDPSVPTSKTGVSNSNIFDVQINNADLSGITKSRDKGYETCGGVINYTVVVPNSGNITAVNVKLVDTIPNGTTVVQNSVYVNGQQQVGANPVSGITLPNISAGNIVTVTYQVKVQC